jgi:biopolymer transport protein ExbD
MEFARPKRIAGGIDLAPLIDCVFLLLIFFMLSSSFLQPAISLDLPSAPALEQPAAHPVTISMNANSELFVNEERVPLSSLAARLQTLTEGDLETPILFRGDRELPYEGFLGVMSATREAGFLRISLQHEVAPDRAP